MPLEIIFILSIKMQCEQRGNDDTVNVTATRLKLQVLNKQRSQQSTEQSAVLR